MWMAPGRPTPRPCYDHPPPSLPPVASTCGAQIMTAQGRGPPGLQGRGSRSLGVVLTGPISQNGVGPAPPWASLAPSL